MASAETAKLWVALNLKDGLTSGIKNATRALGTFDKGAGRVGKGVGQMGLGFARAGAILGAAAVGGIAAATRAAIDFEDAFAGVRKTVDAPEADLQALALGFRQLATEIPIAATEFAKIGELGGALGISPENLLEFTRIVALMGVTTDVSTEQAATALGQLSNVLGLTGADYDNFAAALVDLGNKGASTESQILEISRRSASAASLIGIAKDETLGWAAAAANLGMQEELAGTALQNFYLKALQAVKGGSADLRTLADAAGMTKKQFAAMFEADPTAALEKFIAGLSKLDKGEQLSVVQEVFGKGSGLTRLILGLAGSYEKNLAPSIDTASKAWEENTALQEEARRRFETVRSSVSLLKNNLIEAAMVLGEGVAPAIGRAATKLSEFLKSAENREMLKKLGQDIGRAIDDVDWGRLLDTAKGLASALQPALALVLQLGGLIASLPPGLVGAGAGLVVTNQLSGGLIGSGLGNIFGGLGEVLSKSLLARIPILGKGFVQPVFVTNMGAGGLGGGKGLPTGLLGGAAGAAGAAGGLGVAGAVSALGPALIAAGMLAAPYIFKGPQGSGPKPIAIQGGQGTLSWQQAGMMQGLIPSFTTLAANAGSKSIVPKLTQNQADTRAQLMGEKAQISATNAKLSTTNARLAAIQARRTQFTTSVTVNTSVSVRDLDKKKLYRQSTVKMNQLATV